MFLKLYDTELVCFTHSNSLAFVIKFIKWDSNFEDENEFLVCICNFVLPLQTCEKNSEK